MTLHIVILAAGQGTRMRSKTPKVLHKLAHKPLLQWVIDAAAQLNPEAVHIVVGQHRTCIEEAIHHPLVHWVEQKEALGTGHAVLQAMQFIPKDAQVLILCADVPLISIDLLRQLLQLASSKHHTETLNLLTAKMTDPHGLGRIIRNDQGVIKAIVEEKDADAQQKAVNEIYSGIAVASASALHRWLPKLSPKNAQGEYYLTELIAMAGMGQRGWDGKTFNATAEKCTAENKRAHVLS